MFRLVCVTYHTFYEIGVLLLTDRECEMLPKYLQFLHLSSFSRSRTVIIIVSLHFFPIKKGQLLTAYA